MHEHASVGTPQFTISELKDFCTLLRVIFALLATYICPRFIWFVDGEIDTLAPVGLRECACVGTVFSILGAAP